MKKSDEYRKAVVDAIAIINGTEDDRIMSAYCRWYTPDYAGAVEKVMAFDFDGADD